MVRLINDVHANVERFNQEEAVWRRYEQKRKERRRRFRGTAKLSKKLLSLFDQLDWLATERETRRSDCIGKLLP